MRRKMMHVYRTKFHLAGTVLVIAVPFLFLLYFSKVSHVESKVLFENLFVSFLRMAAAYLIAAVIGWILAIIFYRGKRSDYFLPLFDVLQSFPTTAALPLAVLYWGKSNFTVIFFLAFCIIWPIFFSLINTLRLLKPEWKESTEIGGVRGFQYLRSFLIPVSIPALITGSIIGLGDGWEALVATEIVVGIQLGMGQFFVQFAQNTSVTALGILALLLVVFSINKVIWTPILEKTHHFLED